jgi:hypothetical protein
MNDRVESVDREFFSKYPLSNLYSQKTGFSKQIVLYLAL